MKNIIHISITFVLILSLASSVLFAQCDMPTGIWENTWQSCQTSQNPNASRGVGHWVQYDFGANYTLYDTHIWNTNESGKTNMGFKNVVIDYSVDGSNWTTLGNFQFQQGTGQAEYAGFSGFGFGGATARYVVLTALDNWGHGSCYGFAEVRFNLHSLTPPLTLMAKVVLEGAYNSSAQNMTTTLSTNNLLTDAHPYAQAPWNHTEVVTIVGGINDVVDWVLIEVLDENLMSRTKRVALVDSQGNLRDIDGSNQVKLFGLSTAENYYFILRHKNHIDVMSDVALPLNNTNTYDFSSPDFVKGGVTQLKNLGNGKYGLLAGDFDGNGIISVSDFNKYVAQIGDSSQYILEDVNFDGNVTVDDFNLYTPNAARIGISIVRY